MRMDNPDHHPGLLAGYISVVTTPLQARKSLQCFICSPASTKTAETNSVLSGLLSNVVLLQLKVKPYPVHSNNDQFCSIVYQLDIVSTHMQNIHMLYIPVKN